jgi:hypothetical protein
LIQDPETNKELDPGSWPEMTSDLVTGLELVEGDIDESGRVEKHVLIAAFRGDEAKTLVGQALNSAVHNVIYEG